MTIIFHSFPRDKRSGIFTSKGLSLVIIYYIMRTKICNIVPMFINLKQSNQMESSQHHIWLIVTRDCVGVLSPIGCLYNDFPYFNRLLSLKLCQIDNLLPLSLGNNPLISVKIRD